MAQQPPQPLDFVSLGVSVLSCAVSAAAFLVAGYTAWKTFLQQGRPVMTQPNKIFFGHDGLGGPPKIIVFATVFSTASQGNIIENIFLKLRAGGADYILATWGFVDSGPMLVATGMFLSQAGASGRHHFVLERHMGFVFGPGPYTLEVHASVINQPKTFLLTRVSLQLDQKEANALEKHDFSGGVLFSWDPEQHSYKSDIEDAAPGSVPRI